MIFDSHTHYDDDRYNEDRDEIILRTQSEGVGLIMNVGACLDTSQSSIELAEKYSFIYASVGIHPHVVENIKDGDMEKLYEMSLHEKVMAIGEIGLDYFYDNSPRELQKRWFIRQIDIAKQAHLPIIIHSRDATGDLLKILKSENAGSTGGVLHCFSGSKETMNEVLKFGFYVAFGGAVTFKNAVRIRDAVKSIPDDKILIETVCPYLSPEPYRGKRNYSTYLRYVIEKIAEIRGTTSEYIEELTFNNAAELFKIKSFL